MVNHRFGFLFLATHLPKVDLLTFPICWSMFSQELILYFEVLWATGGSSNHESQRQKPGHAKATSTSSHSRSFGGLTALVASERPKDGVEFSQTLQIGQKTGLNAPNRLAVARDANE